MRPLAQESTGVLQILQLCVGVKFLSATLKKVYLPAQCLTVILRNKNHAEPTLGLNEIMWEWSSTQYASFGKQELIPWLLRS